MASTKDRLTFICTMKITTSFEAAAEDNGGLQDENAAACSQFTQKEHNDKMQLCPLNPLC